MHVYYCGDKSRTFIATSGVPQGTNLAALLFAIFINDLPGIINAEVLLFADDVKILKTINNQADCHALQDQINKLMQWCEMNKLELNINKCCVMSYTRAKQPILNAYKIGNECLKRAQETTDLGITFQSDLSFRNHVANIIKNTYRTMGMVIRNCSYFKSTAPLEMLYCSLIRPKLEYCTQIWSPHDSCLINDVESIQRKYLKFLHFKKHGVYPEIGSSAEILRSEFKMDSMEKRRIFNDINFVRKLINGDVESTHLIGTLNFYVPRINSRYHPTFYVDSSRRDAHKFSPINRMCSQVNELLNGFDIFSASKKDICSALEMQ